MNRDIFINKIEKMYNDCIQSVSEKGRYKCFLEIYQKEMIEEGCKTIRELGEIKKEYISLFEYDIDIKKINEITNNNKINPFLKLYSLDTDILEDIYILLSKTHRAIDYYNKYSSKSRKLKEENKTSKGKNPKENKILDVMDIIYEHDIRVEECVNKLKAGEKIEDKYKPDGYKALRYLNGLLITLKNIHYTKIQLYQNLLYEMYFLLKDKYYINNETNKENKFSKNLIFDIVDKLIKYYFCESDSQIIENEKDRIFTTSINFDKYIEKNYIYETMAGITLTHSTKGMEF